jgi:hypothetical protein
MFNVERSKFDVPGHADPEETTDDNPGPDCSVGL